MLDVYPKPINFMNGSEPRTDQLTVSAGTVLLSRSGTIGNLAFVGGTLSKLLVSEHAIRLECKENAGYVYCYLKSQTAQALIKSKKFGAVIQEIEPEHLADIPVPNPPDEIKAKINDLVVRSFELRDESNELLDKATAMLIEELKLPPLEDFQVKRTDDGAGVNAYSVKLSELAGRLDGSYHLPIVKAITKHLREHAAEVTTVGDKRVCKDIILPGRFKRVYVDEGQGRVFIGGKQIHELDPYGKKYLSLTHHGDRIKKQLELAENMTLITCSGTIGKVALVPRHWNNWAASQHIIRVVPANSDVAGYLSVYLASDCGRQMITRYTYGSVVDEIDDNHVSQIPLPLLKDAVAQAEINRLALKANELRYQAYVLEQEAMGVLENDVLLTNCRRARK
ncbi:type I restriction-modification system restriction endonuclease DNA specificity subunit HsdS [Synergistales bacterium]|nr:type I restriction-modification system restriction endonuclease DNA specificity subunit HsdS [Synergistales bacterium]